MSLIFSWHNRQAKMAAYGRQAVASGSKSKGKEAIERMKLLIVSIFVFLVIMYVYAYKRYKKNKNNSIDTVGDFRRKYLQKNRSNQNQEDQVSNNYFTKYNSSIDYIEKDVFMKEASESKSEQELKQMNNHFKY